MGTVHGVYLKYVGISALSYFSYSFLAAELPEGSLAALLGLQDEKDDSEEKFPSLMEMLPALIMAYSAFLNGIIAILFKLEWGMAIIGKDRQAGTIPLWSYLLFFPFHIPTIMYTRIHTRTSRMKVLNPKTGKQEKVPVPVASEVQKGWWVGGCHADELGPKEWGGIIDLTVEFPESCRKHTKHYLSAPTWDGVPLSPADLDSAANFGVEASKDGDVIVHCAHGRGRSTTVMCACLVRAGLYSNWEDAFSKGIKPNRPVCKLNKRMRQNLAAWQAEYVDGKKAA